MLSEKQLLLLGDLSFQLYQHIDQPFFRGGFVIVLTFFIMLKTFSEIFVEEDGWVAVFCKRKGELTLYRFFIFLRKSVSFTTLLLIKVKLVENGYLDYTQLCCYFSYWSPTETNLLLQQFHD